MPTKTAESAYFFSASSPPFLSMTSLWKVFAVISAMFAISISPYVKCKRPR